MKPVKKNKSVFKEYGPTIVWLDDIQEIIALFEGGAVDVSTDEYQFASLDEAREHFASLPTNSFKISSSKPSADVEFGRMFSKIYVGGSPTSLQLYHELDDIMRRCQRRPTIFFRYLFVVLAAQVPWAVSFLWEPKIGSVPIMVILQLLLIAWMIWVTFIQVRRHSVIRLQRRHEAPPFFQRNKDQLLMLLIGAIVGGAITLAFTVVKERFYPSAATVVAPKQE